MLALDLNKRVFSVRNGYVVMERTKDNQTRRVQISTDPLFVEDVLIKE